MSTGKNQPSEVPGLNTVRPRQLANILEKVIPAKFPLIIVGGPGVGKTTIARQVAKRLPWFREYQTAEALEGKEDLKIGWDVITDHPVYGDPTDGKGIPWIDQENKRAEYFPAGTLASVLSAKRPTLWLIDDFGQASNSVQASYMPPLLDRTVNGHPIPDCVAVVATTNRRTDRAAVTGLLEPVKSRFVSILHLETNLEDWCEWAIDASIHPSVISYLRNSDDDKMLNNFQPTADLTNSPCPRTWENVSKVCQLGLPKDEEFATVCGAIGQGAAATFYAWLEVSRDMPPIDSILMAPDSAVIPESPPALWTVVTALASRANTRTFPNITVYVNRLFKEGLGEYGSLCVQDIMQRDPSLAASSTAFTTLMAQGLGRLVQGQI